MHILKTIFGTKKPTVKHPTFSAYDEILKNDISLLNELVMQQMGTSIAKRITKQFIRVFQILTSLSENDVKDINLKSQGDFNPFNRILTVIRQIRGKKEGGEDRSTVLYHTLLIECDYLSKYLKSGS